MAPRSAENCSILGHSTKHTRRRPRPTREGWVRTLRHVDATISKEEFLCSMGLRMKRAVCGKDTSMPPSRARRINIPSGVKLKECSVVIIGASCNVCWKDFKCKTDVELHSAWRHGTNFTRDDDAASNDETQVVQKQPLSEKRRKHSLRLILKIGEEVVSEVVLKRKYLKFHSISTGTQTEHCCGEPIDSHVKNIDPSNPGNGVDAGHATCVQPLRDRAGQLDENVVLNRGNRGNAIRHPCEDLNCEENALVKRLRDADTRYRFDEIYDDVTWDVRHVGNDTVSNKENVHRQSEQSVVTDVRNRFGVKNGTIGRSSGDNHAISPSYGNQMGRHNSVGQKVNLGREKLVDKRVLDNRSNVEDHSVNDLHNESVEIITDDDISEIVPVTSPISATQLAGVSPKRKECDDEVQEILRIKRKRLSTDGDSEINHESPNKTEREILLLDAIKEMMNIERRLQRWRPGSDISQSLMDEISVEEDIVNLELEENREIGQRVNAHIFDERMFQEESEPKDSAMNEHVECSLADGNSTPEVLHVRFEDFERYGIRYYNEMAEFGNVNNRQSLMAGSV